MKIGKNRERPVPSEPEEGVGDFLSRVYTQIHVPYYGYSLRLYDAEYLKTQELLPIALVRRDARRLYDLATHLVNIRKALG